MKNAIVIPFLCAVSSVFAADAMKAPIEAYLYKYTDADGSLYIGRQIPPENYKYGYTALDEFGEVIEVVPPAPTDEERSAHEAEIRRQEEERVRQQKDEQLLKAYSSAADALNARERKLAQIDVTIEIMQAKQASMRISYDQELESAAERERVGKAPIPQTLKNMEEIEQSMRELDKSIEEKRREKDVIRQEFEPLITRLKEIEAEPASTKTAAHP